MAALAPGRHRPVRSARAARRSAIIDAGEVTAIRTAAASAAATDALARADAATLAILGYGEQALAPRRGDRLRAQDRADHGLGPRPRPRRESFAARMSASSACAERRRREVAATPTSSAPSPPQPSRSCSRGRSPTARISTRSAPAARAPPRSTTTLVARARFFADHEAGVLRPGRRIPARQGCRPDRRRSPARRDRRGLRRHDRRAAAAAPTSPSTNRSAASCRTWPRPGISWGNWAPNGDACLRMPGRNRS